MRRLVLGVVFLLLYGWFLSATEVSLARLVRGVPWMADFLRRMFPPDLSVLQSAMVGALQTLQIAVVGTTVAAVLALPLGFLSARNVASGPIFYPARAVLNFFRSIDTMVYALFFVAAVGLGPFPGVLAVVTYTTMTLAKLYSEAIGNRTGPMDAIARRVPTALRCCDSASCPGGPVTPRTSCTDWDEHPGGGGWGFVGAGNRLYIRRISG
jgi:phosphonate transport system permease protein